MLDPWCEEADVTVCFTGHRFIPAVELSGVRKRLEDTVSDLYRQGYTRFICGGALGFDTLAALSVLDFRKEHPDVRLLLAVPCADQDESWNPSDRKTYRKILESADGVQVLSDRYTHGCMQTRNRCMVDHSAVCVAWLTKLGRSGTMYTVRYAMSRELRIINLALES